MGIIIIGAVAIILICLCSAVVSALIMGSFAWFGSFGGWLTVLAFIALFTFMVTRILEAVNSSKRSHRINSK